MRCGILPVDAVEAGKVMLHQPAGIYYYRFSGDGWSRTLPLVVR